MRTMCPVCKRESNLLYGNFKQGSLPQSRRTIMRPFEVIGVDFAGPIFRATFAPPFDESPYGKSKGHKAKKSNPIIPEPSVLDTADLDDPLRDAPGTSRKKEAESVDSTGARIAPEKLSYFVYQLNLREYLCSSILFDEEHQNPIHGNGLG